MVQPDLAVKGEGEVRLGDASFSFAHYLNLPNVSFGHSANDFLSWPTHISSFVKEQTGLCPVFGSSPW